MKNTTRCEVDTEWSSIDCGFKEHTSHVRLAYALDETGAPMKVQQEFMRHASIQPTMNVYGRAVTETKRRAKSQVAGLVFGPNSQQPTATADSATIQQIAAFLMGDNGDLPEAIDRI